MLGHGHELSVLFAPSTFARHAPRYAPGQREVADPTTVPPAFRSTALDPARADASPRRGVAARIVAPDGDRHGA